MGSLWWGGVMGLDEGGSLGGTQGGIETRCSHGTEREYEETYIFGACRPVGRQARSVTNPYKSITQIMWKLNN